MKSISTLTSMHLSTRYSKKKRDYFSVALSLEATRVQMNVDMSSIEHKVELPLYC